MKPSLPEVTLAEAVEKAVGANIHFVARMNAWDALPSDSWTTMQPLWPHIIVLAVNHNNSVTRAVIRRFLQDCPRLDVLDVYSCADCTIADVVAECVETRHAHLEAVYAGNKLHAPPTLADLQLPRLRTACPQFNTLPVVYNGSLGLFRGSDAQRHALQLDVREALPTQRRKNRCMYS